MSRRAELKICVACSTGGHMVQAMQLAPIYEKHEHFYFTFAGGVADRMRVTRPVRTIPNISRRSPWSVIRGTILSAGIALRERPDLVITTGAGVVVLFCIFAKMLGAKLVFIESMANVRKPTLTARLLYPFSDLFLVQWPALLRFFPRARCAGRFF